MFLSPSKEMLETIDALLDDGVLDEATSETLCEMLDPGANGSGLDLEGVLYLAEHPVVREAVDDKDLTAGLAESLNRAIGTVSAMLGEWSGAPFSAQTDRLRRRFEREQKKYQLVRERLQEEDVQSGAEILGRYLETSPAPIFSEQLAADFDDMYRKSQAQQSSGRELLVGDQRLLELLSFDETIDDEDFDELDRRLTKLVEQIDDIDGVVDRGLVKSEADGQLVAAAIAAKRGIEEQSHRMLMNIVSAGPNAPQFAAFSARLSPSITRHVLSRFLVDVLNDSEPTEAGDIDEDDLRRSIVAARTVLPLVGGDIDEIDQINAEAKQTASRARRAWEFCERYDG